MLSQYLILNGWTIKLWGRCFWLSARQYDINPLNIGRTINKVTNMWLLFLFQASISRRIPPSPTSMCMVSVVARDVRPTRTDHATCVIDNSSCVVWRSGNPSSSSRPSVWPTLPPGITRWSGARVTEVSRTRNMSFIEGNRYAAGSWGQFF